MTDTKHRSIPKLQGAAILRRPSDTEKRVVSDRAKTDKPVHEMDAAERIHRYFADIGFDEGEFAPPDRTGRQPAASL